MKKGELDQRGRYHFPEIDNGPDVPNEAYIKLKSQVKTLTYSVNESGEKVKNPIKISVQEYYYPIGSSYDSLSGTGIRAIMGTLRRREARGHMVTGFGNFNQSAYFDKLAKLLKRETALRLSDPENPMRLQLQREMEAQGQPNIDEITAKIRAELEEDYRKEVVENADRLISEQDKELPLAQTAKTEKKEDGNAKPAKDEKAGKSNAKDKAAETASGNERN